MNRRKEWKNLLKIANEDLKPYGYALDVNDDDEEGFFKCEILKDGEVVDTYAENYYEDELDELVNDAWHYVKSERI